MENLIAMRAERRHKLETNQLADWVGRSAETARPFWPWVIAALGVLAVVVVGWNLWTARANAAQVRSWQEFLGARAKMTQALATSNTADADEFLEIASRYPDSSVTPWAKLYAADVYYHNGMAELFKNRDAATAMLARAQRTYEEVSKSSVARGPLIGSWAMRGEAGSLEAQGKVPQAIEKYQEVEKRWPTPGTDTPDYRRSLIGEAAAERVESLKQAWAKDFYADLEKAKITPAKSSEKAPPSEPSNPVFPGPGASDVLPPGHPPIGPSSTESGPKSEPKDIATPSLPATNQSSTESPAKTETGSKQ